MTLSAQTAPQTPDRSDEIVVTGKREASETVRQRAAAYVRALGVANGERAVARWIDPICPKVLGISERNAGLVESQIRAVAGSLGVATAKLPCKSNIVVSFVSNGAAVARGISTREARQFSEVPAEKRQDLFDGDAPIRWWYATELRGKDGDRPVDFAPPAAQIDGGGSFPLGSDTQVLSQYNSSIISTQTVRALRSATIIVDVDRAQGATLNSVAAYAAMVGLAEIQLSGETPPHSILALFEGAAPVSQLTGWDKSFLLELYRVPLDRLARYQRRRLTGAIAEGVSEP